MKHLFSLLIALAACSAMAQQDRVKEIRQLYAQAQQDIKIDKSEPHAQNTMDIKTHYTASAVGLIEETINYFFTSTENYCIDGSGHYMPYFVRVKRAYLEASSGSGVSEYLFDTNTGNLIFCFIKNENYEGDENLYDEQRFYFNANGTLCSSNAVVKQKSDKSQVTTFVANEEEALRQSLRLKDIFNMQMNSDLIDTSTRENNSTADLTFFELSGPVKQVSVGLSTTIFDRNGRLILNDGVDPFRASGPNREMLDDGSFYDVAWMQRDARGLICCTAYIESKSDFNVAADGRVLSETSCGEGYASQLKYEYDNAGRITRISEQEIDIDAYFEGEIKNVGKPVINSFTYPSIDSHGNWTTRKDSNGYQTKRTIEYY